ncbi:class I SAM-dependent methyltransferase [Tessaracoccus terricola]
MTPEAGKWSRMIAVDPEHSHRYIQRFKMMAQAGHDLVGEARTVHAMVSPGSRILDAGCGPGRHAAHLHELGHHVVGVDVDPVLVEAARADHPGPEFVVQDLAELDLPAQGIEAGFDAILCAGNVVGFLAESTRVEVLRRLGAHLAPEGRAVIGFGAGRGYEFDEFFADVAAAGLVVELKLSTWDLRPFTPDSTFLVAVLGRP